MKKARKYAGLFVAVALLAGMSLGAQLETAVDAAAWIKEDLSDSVPSVSFSDDGGTANVQFYTRGSSIPQSVRAGLGADATVMAELVVGDYRDVEGLSLQVTRSGGMEADLHVALQGTTGAVWNHRITGQLSSQDGEACVVNVPLDPSEWKYGGRMADWNSTWMAAWNDDIANVTEIRILIKHQSFDNERVSVGNFRLIGENFISNPAVLQLVREHFDADISNSDQLTQTQRAQDSDRDGRSDLAALIDEEDPGLYVEILGVDAQGRARVRWPSVKGRRYRLERTQDLTGDERFDTVPIDNPVADQAGTMERTDNSEVPEDGIFFYRAIKE